MSRFLAAVLLFALSLSVAAPAARAQVRVERQGAENPMVEIARSTLYGGLAGLMVGGAIAWATESDDSDEIVKWGFVTGTFVGLGVGIAFTASRPQPRALLELDDGTLRANALPTIEPARGGLRAHLVGLRF